MRSYPPDRRPWYWRLAGAPFVAVLWVLECFGWWLLLLVPAALVGGAMLVAWFYGGVA